MTNDQHLFSQERRELQEREGRLQARCDDLESTNRALSQQVADLELKQELIQHSEGQEQSEHVSCDGEEMPVSKEKTFVETRDSWCQTEEVPSFQELSASCQEKTEGSWQEEKTELTQKLSAVQAELVAQQVEMVKLQEKEAELERQHALLDAQVKDAETENHALMNDIHMQQQSEKELKGRYGLLEEKLETVSDYQDIVGKKNELQAVCNSLEAQRAVSEENLSSLHQDNQRLSGENKAMTSKCEELQQIVRHLQVIENNYHALEVKYNCLQETKKHCVQYEHSSIQVCLEADNSVEKVLKDGNVDYGKEMKRLQDRLGTLKDDKKFLHEKINILENNVKLSQNQCQTVQVRNKLLEYQAETHSNRCEILQTDLQSVRDSLQAAEAWNKSLQDKVHDLERSLKKSAALEKENKSLSEELTHLKESDSSLQSDCKMLQEKCQALQDELQEATQSGQSLREQLHEQSITLEHVISEMREQSSPQDVAEDETDSSERKRRIDSGAELWQVETRSPFYRTEAEMRRQLSKYEEVLLEKDKLIAEFKEQLTVLSLQQAAQGAPPALRESANDLELEVQDLREELMEKEGVIQELQEQTQSLKQSHGELRRKIKEDSDLEQEVSILHQALFEKEKVIQELKETSMLLQLSQQEKVHAVKRHGSSSQSSGLNADKGDKCHAKDENRSQVLGSEYQRKKVDAISSRSLESAESIAISSDPDSDISPGQDMDIVKEMGRLRKDIKRTKAVYANESALFQEALDREPVSQLGARNCRSPSSCVDVTEMTQNDIPDDSEELKKIVVRLLEENKCLTTENLRLQLRIRDQEALVVEMEEKLQNIKHPPDDWQTLFERQLLLLQKQRDELQHLICERDAGVGLLSAKVGKEGIEAAALQQKQEDLTVKIGELEHCHQLLQQRQAELAHCQAEKRHLEQILLLKDETERQLMRQKRLLEEELSTIEGKLQDREAALVEEKALLMKELKEKEQHIFHLQSSQQRSSQPTSVLTAGPQSASTPYLSKKFEASQAYFLRPLSPQEQDPSVLHRSEEGAQGGSFLEGPAEEPVSSAVSPKTSSFSNEEPKDRAVSHITEGHLVSRRHSTGALGSGRLSPSVVRLPKDPNELYKFHREAVDRLREKLKLQKEEEMSQMSEGQASAVTGYWQRHGSQRP